MKYCQLFNSDIAPRNARWIENAMTLFRMAAPQHARLSKHAHHNPLI